MQARLAGEKWSGKRRSKSTLYKAASNFAEGVGGSGQASSAMKYNAELRAEAELRGIAAIVRARWPLDVLLQRRISGLAGGEIIPLPGVCAAASADSFASCQLGLDFLKKMRTIDRREVFIDTKGRDAHITIE